MDKKRHLKFLTNLPGTESAEATKGLDFTKPVSRKAMGKSHSVRLLKGANLDIKFWLMAARYAIVAEEKE